MVVRSNGGRARVVSLTMLLCAMTLSLSNSIEGLGKETDLDDLLLLLQTGEGDSIENLPLTSCYDDGSKRDHGCYTAIGGHELSKGKGWASDKDSSWAVFMLGAPLSVNSVTIVSGVGDATHRLSHFLIKFKTADGKWHEPTDLQLVSGLGISAAINGGEVKASATNESSLVPSLRWKMQMTCDAVADVEAIKITLQNNAAIVAEVLVGGPREDILVHARTEEKFAEVTVINHHVEYNKTVAYQGLANEIVKHVNDSFVRAKTYHDELSKTAKQANTIADEKYDEYKVTVENVNARLKTLANAKTEVESTLENLKKETDAARKIQTEDIPKVVAARTGAMKMEEEALKNVTNADIAQNAAMDKVKLLMAEKTEAETKVEIAKRNLNILKKKRPLIHHYRNATTHHVNVADGALLEARNQTEKSENIYIKSTEHVEDMLNRTMEAENLIRSRDLAEHDAVAAVKADEDALSAARNTSNEVELQTKVAVKAAEMYAESEAAKVTAAEDLVGEKETALNTTQESIASLKIEEPALHATIQEAQQITQERNAKALISAEALAHGRTKYKVQEMEVKMAQKELTATNGRIEKAKSDLSKVMTMAESTEQNRKAEIESAHQDAEVESKSYEAGKQETQKIAEVAAAMAKNASDMQPQVQKEDEALAAALNAVQAKRELADQQVEIVQNDLKQAEMAVGKATMEYEAKISDQRMTAFEIRLAEKKKAQSTEKLTALKLLYTKLKDQAKQAEEDHAKVMNRVSKERVKLQADIQTLPALTSILQNAHETLLARVEKLKNATEVLIAENTEVAAVEGQIKEVDEKTSVLSNLSVSRQDYAHTLAKEAIKIDDASKAKRDQELLIAAKVNATQKEVDQLVEVVGILTADSKATISRAQDLRAQMSAARAVYEAAASNYSDASNYTAHTLAASQGYLDLSKAVEQRVSEVKNSIALARLAYEKAAAEYKAAVTPAVLSEAFANSSLSQLGKVNTANDESLGLFIAAEATEESATSGATLWKQKIENENAALEKAELKIEESATASKESAAALNKTTALLTEAYAKESAVLKAVDESGTAAKEQIQRESDERDLKIAEKTNRTETEFELPKLPVKHELTTLKDQSVVGSIEMLRKAQQSAAEIKAAALQKLEEVKAALDKATREEEKAKESVSKISHQNQHIEAAANKVITDAKATISEKHQKMMLKAEEEAKKILDLSASKAFQIEAQVDPLVEDAKREALASQRMAIHAALVKEQAVKKEAAKNFVTSNLATHAVVEHITSQAEADAAALRHSADEANARLVRNAHEKAAELISSPEEDLFMIEEVEGDVIELGNPTPAPNNATAAVFDRLEKGAAGAGAVMEVDMAMAESASAEAAVMSAKDRVTASQDFSRHAQDEVAAERIIIKDYQDVWRDAVNKSAEGAISAAQAAKKGLQDSEKDLSDTKTTYDQAVAEASEKESKALALKAALIERHAEFNQAKELSTLVEDELKTIDDHIKAVQLETTARQLWTIRSRAAKKSAWEHYLTVKEEAAAADDKATMFVTLLTQAKESLGVRIAEVGSLKLQLRSLINEEALLSKDKDAYSKAVARTVAENAVFFKKTDEFKKKKFELRTNRLKLKKLKALALKDTAKRQREVNAAEEFVSESKSKFDATLSDLALTYSKEGHQTAHLVDSAAKMGDLQEDVAREKVLLNSTEGAVAKASEAAEKHEASLQAIEPFVLAKNAELRNLTNAETSLEKKSAMRNQQLEAAQKEVTDMDLTRLRITNMKAINAKKLRDSQKALKRAKKASHERGADLFNAKYIVLERKAQEVAEVAELKKEIHLNEQNVETIIPAQAVIEAKIKEESAKEAALQEMYESLHQNASEVLQLANVAEINETKVERAERELQESIQRSFERKKAAKDLLHAAEGAMRKQEAYAKEAADETEKIKEVGERNMNTTRDEVDKAERQLKDAEAAKEMSSTRLSEAKEKLASIQEQTLQAKSVQALSFGDLTESKRVSEKAEASLVLAKEGHAESSAAVTDFEAKLARADDEEKKAIESENLTESEIITANKTFNTTTAIKESAELKLTEWRDAILNEEKLYQETLNKLSSTKTSINATSEALDQHTKVEKAEYNKLQEAKSDQVIADTQAKAAVAIAAVEVGYANNMSTALDIQTEITNKVTGTYKPLENGTSYLHDKQKKLLNKAMRKYEYLKQVIAQGEASKEKDSKLELAEKAQAILDEKKKAQEDEGAEKKLAVEEEAHEKALNHAEAEAKDQEKRDADDEKKTKVEQIEAEEREMAAKEAAKSEGNAELTDKTVDEKVNKKTDIKDSEVTDKELQEKAEEEKANKSAAQEEAEAAKAEIKPADEEKATVEKGDSSH